MSESNRTGDKQFKKNTIVVNALLYFELFRNFPIEDSMYAIAIVAKIMILNLFPIAGNVPQASFTLKSKTASILLWTIKIIAKI
jgi:hypothetical protein